MCVQAEHIGGLYGDYSGEVIVLAHLDALIFIMGGKIFRQYQVDI